MGATGFCRIWILGYSKMAHTLYELLTGPEGDSLNWTERQQQPCEELKLVITSAPALGLPDLAKPFTLYVTEEDKVAMGVLSQTMGTRDRPVAYLPKWLDSVAAGWPGCNQAEFGPKFDHKSPALGQHSPARRPPQMAVDISHILPRTSKSMPPRFGETDWQIRQLNKQPREWE